MVRGFKAERTQGWTLGEGLGKGEGAQGIPPSAADRLGVPGLGRLDSQSFPPTPEDGVQQRNGPPGTGPDPWILSRRQSSEGGVWGLQEAFCKTHLLLLGPLTACLPFPGNQPPRPWASRRPCLRGLGSGRGPGDQGAPADAELGGEGPCLLVEEEGHLAVEERVVVDGGQARAELHLGPLVAQVHGRRQRQLVVPGRVQRVLETDGESPRGQHRARAGGLGGASPWARPPARAAPGLARERSR